MPPKVAQPQGGAIYRGGVPGNAGNKVSASLESLKRRARAHLHELEEAAYELAKRGLIPAKPKEGEEPEAYASRLARDFKLGLEAMRVIASIAEPTMAESKSETPDHQPPTITVRTAQDRAGSPPIPPADPAPEEKATPGPILGPKPPSAGSGAS